VNHGLEAFFVVVFDPWRRYAADGRGRVHGVLEQIRRLRLESQLPE
jgi:hypothetical protein